VPDAHTHSVSSRGVRIMRRRAHSRISMLSWDFREFGHAFEPNNIVPGTELRPTRCSSPVGFSYADAHPRTGGCG